MREDALGTKGAIPSFLEYALNLLLALSLHALQTLGTWSLQSHWWVMRQLVARLLEVHLPLLGSRLLDLP